MPIEKVNRSRGRSDRPEELEIVLRRRRYDVAAVETIAAAREYLEKDNFDVVFADVRLPDGDGTSLLKAVQERAQKTVGGNHYRLRQRRISSRVYEEWGV